MAASTPGSSLPAAAMAKLLDITQRRLQQGVDEGWAVRAERGHYLMIPTVQGYIRTLRDQAQNHTANFADARARKEAAQAQKAEIELAELEGRVLIREHVVQTWADGFKVFSRSMRALHSQAVTRLGLSKEKAHQLLAMIDRCLNELAGYDLAREDQRPRRRKKSVGRGKSKRRST